MIIQNHKNSNWPNHEVVAVGRDETIGYEGVIAVHSTKLGPAVGGTRYWAYESVHAAIDDACRLSEGMTYKSALAGLSFGGGKSVIRAQPGTDRSAIFRAHGRFIEEFRGAYITAEDVGTTPADMAVIREETRHVAGLPTGAGDPGPWTARGVFQAIAAALNARYGTTTMEERTIAIQGCGAVGASLARQLSEAGAKLILADVVEHRAAALAKTLGAGVVPPESIYAVEADVFAPCALGAILNDVTAQALNTSIVAGAANNQLAHRDVANSLSARGILYVPDYAANAGGVISGSFEILDGDIANMPAAVDQIFDTVARVLERARLSGKLPLDEAEAMVLERLGYAI